MLTVNSEGALRLSTRLAMMAVSAATDTALEGGIGCSRDGHHRQSRGQAQGSLAVYCEHSTGQCATTIQCPRSHHQDLGKECQDVQSTVERPSQYMDLGESC